MRVLDVVKWDVLSDNYIVYKYQSEEQWALRLGSKLVVNEGQEAIFVKGGVALDTFTPGTHTLVSGNLPLLSKIINSIFNSKTPFTAEVWFINKTAKRNMKWGTPHRVPLFDPSMGVPINVGAFGQWGFRIDDSRKFMTQIVGAQLGADSNKIYDYFIGEIIESFTETVSIMINGGLSVFQINMKLRQISDAVQTAVAETFNSFGIELVNFNISNISIPQEEMGKIQDVMTKKLEIQQLSSVPVGQGYLATKSFEVMNNVAQNEGAVGNLMGLGAGLGLVSNGVQPMTQQVGAAVQASPDANDPMAKLKKLKTLLDEGILTEEEYKAKKNAIIDAL